MGGKISSLANKVGFRNNNNNDVDPISNPASNEQTAANDTSVVAPAPAAATNPPVAAPAPAPAPVPAPMPVKSVISYPSLTQDLSVNIYWKNAPPADCPVYWAYSSTNGHDYYFMTSHLAAQLEKIMNSGANEATVNISGGWSFKIVFSKGKQYSTCGGISRNVRRITKETYASLSEEYANYFNKRDVLWCLKCKSSYVLYTPQYQEELDRSYRDGTILTVKTNDRYTYKIDTRYYTQQNTNTGKIRDIARVYPGCNDKPIFGTYHYRQSIPENQSIMDRSCIYHYV